MLKLAHKISVITRILTADVRRIEAVVGTAVRDAKLFLYAERVSFEALAVITAKPPLRAVAMHCSHIHRMVIVMDVNVVVPCLRQ